MLGLVLLDGVHPAVGDIGIGIASVGHTQQQQAESGLLGGLRASIVNWAHTAGRVQACVVSRALLGTHSRQVEGNPAAVE